MTLLPWPLPCYRWSMGSAHLSHWDLNKPEEPSPLTGGPSAGLRGVLCPGASATQAVFPAAPRSSDSGSGPREGRAHSGARMKLPVFWRLSETQPSCAPSEMRDPLPPLRAGFFQWSDQQWLALGKANIGIQAFIQFHPGHTRPGSEGTVPGSTPSSPSLGHGGWNSI